MKLYSFTFTALNVQFGRGRATCEDTWLVEMWEPVFDLIKQWEPESGHLLSAQQIIFMKVKEDTCSAPAQQISFITSRPLGSCSSPDQPSCPRPGNSQIGEEPLRFVFNKQARRTKTVSLASLWSILNSPMNLKTLGWSYQTVCEFWPLSIECWIMICNSKPSAYPDYATFTAKFTTGWQELATLLTLTLRVQEYKSIRALSGTKLRVSARTASCSQCPH